MPLGTLVMGTVPRDAAGGDVVGGTGDAGGELLVLAVPKHPVPLEKINEVLRGGSGTGGVLTGFMGGPMGGDYMGGHGAGGVFGEMGGPAGDGAAGGGGALAAALAAAMAGPGGAGDVGGTGLEAGVVFKKRKAKDPLAPKKPITGYQVGRGLAGGCWLTGLGRVRVGRRWTVCVWRDAVLRGLDGSHS